MTGRCGNQLCSLAQLWAVASVTVLAGILCCIHGEIGGAKNSITVLAISWICRDANRSTYSDVLSANVDRSTYFRQQPTCKIVSGIRALVPFEDHGKLVAAEPKGHRRPQLAYPPTDCPQDCVAGMMTERIIDGLEAIEIEYHQAEWFNRLRDICSAPKFCVEQVSVSKTRHLIDVGGVPKIKLAIMGICHILEHTVYHRLALMVQAVLPSAFEAAHLSRGMAKIKLLHHGLNTQLRILRDGFDALANIRRKRLQCHFQSHWSAVRYPIELVDAV
jgi:hypothetical protein